MAHRLHLQKFVHNLLHPGKSNSKGVGLNRTVQPTGSRLRDNGSSGTQSRRKFLGTGVKAVAGVAVLGVAAKKGWDWHTANVMKKQHWVNGCSTFLKTNKIRNNTAWAEYYYDAFKGNKNPIPLRFETMAEINKFAELIARSENAEVNAKYLERALETIRLNYKAVYFRGGRYDPAGPGYNNFMMRLETASRGRTMGKQNIRNFNVLSVVESFHRLPQGMREEIARFVGY